MRAESNAIYAGFWRRAVALLIDSVILCLFAAACVGLLIATRDPGHTGRGTGRWVMAGVLTVWLIYFPALESSRFQATVGKRLLRIEVTRTDGTRISVGRAAARYLAKTLSGLTLCFGYAMAAFTRQRQALHDRIASTVVVRRSATTSAMAAADAPRQIPRLEAILISIAVMAAGPLLFEGAVILGIPAYQDYRIRTQTATALVAADRYEAAIAQAGITGAALRSLTPERLGIAAGDTGSPYISEIGFADGAIVIAFGREADRAITDKLLLVVPSMASDGTILWTCGHAPTTGELIAPYVEIPDYFAVPSRYLPISCRASG